MNFTPSTLTTAFSGTPELTFAALCLAAYEAEHGTTTPPEAGKLFIRRLQEQTGRPATVPQEPPLDWDAQPEPKNIDEAFQQLADLFDDYQHGVPDWGRANRVLDFLAAEMGYRRIHGTEPQVRCDAESREL